MNEEKSSKSVLGSARIWVIEALAIIGIIGGAIVSDPAGVGWKVITRDLSMSSQDLTKACRNFVEWWRKHNDQNC